MAQLRTREPMTDAQLREVAPSVFATEPYHAVSDRYGYVPTVDVIRGMRSAGFEPFAAKQSRTKLVEKREHTKHQVRFRVPGTASMVDVGGVYPEIVMTNSHDGTSAYKLMAGMFRLVCSNGLVVSDSQMESISIRHGRNVVTEVAERSLLLAERVPETLETVKKWQTIELTQNEQGIYAEAAHAIRFADADGQIDTPIRPGQLLRPRRYSDTNANLWDTFNRVQENVIKGGLQAYKPGAKRVTSTRAVTGISEDARLNRALWMLTQRMAELHA